MTGCGEDRSRSWSASNAATRAAASAIAVWTWISRPGSMPAISERVSFCTAAASVRALAECPPEMGFSYPANQIWRLWALGQGGRADVIVDDFRRRFE